MNLNAHSNLKGQHALFSPSKSSWLRYSPEKILARLYAQYRTSIGTEIHEFAAEQITLSHRITSARQLKQAIESFLLTKYQAKGDSYLSYAFRLIRQLGYLPDEVLEVVKQYINDAVGYKMRPEQILYYSDNVFGTTDAILCRDNFLRIHDLKTGDSDPDMEQLLVYAALFCLEENQQPEKLVGAELRIYHHSGILVFEPTADDISPVMEQIVLVDQVAGEFLNEGDAM